MSGVQFVIDDQGEKTAVVIDLKKYGRMWVDFYDTLIVEQRKHEPRETLLSVKKKLQKSGKL